MKLVFSGEERVHAPQQAVWEHLMDPAFVAGCVPEIESVESDPEGGYRAVARLGLGPIRLRFALKLVFDDLDPPTHGGFRVHAKAPGSQVESMSRFDLVADGAHTRVAWQAEADVRGTVAATGARLLKPAASKAATAFWETFAARVSGEQA